MKYWFKCEECKKQIKREPKSIISKLICLKCRKNKKAIVTNCQQCSKEIPAYNSSRRKNKFCSKNCNRIYNVDNNLFSRCKYYELYSPFLNETIKLQGSWEYKYAIFLTENNIKWVKGTKNKILYIKNGIQHSYYPDFYLPDTQEYIEIKGYYDDVMQKKMKLVIEQNQMLKIIMLFENDLKKLNII